MADAHAFESFINFVEERAATDKTWNLGLTLCLLTAFATLVCS